MKVMLVFGTRPEAIKLAPVIRELRMPQVPEGSPADAAVPDGLPTVRVCVTAQHREMLDQVLRLFDIRPDHDLRVMESNQTPTQVASAVLARLEPLLAAERPDWVVVQGDTTTVAAAALAAFYARARVAHVEAGLRTRDKWRPFPEEMNRRVAGVLADLHLAATEGARRNLLAEGVPPDRILVTGNPVIDALQWAAAMPPTPEVRALLRQAGVEAAEQGGGGSPRPAGRSAPRLLFVTAHRRENFGAPLEQICLALREIADRYAGGVRVLYAVHLNPNVREPVHRLLGGQPHVLLTPPLDYLATVHLVKSAALVLTDSGGLQEEAPSLGKPVLVLREVTERPEGVEAGTARVVGTARARIVAEAVRLLDDPAAYAAMATAVNPYGDGRASGRIVRALRERAPSNRTT
jgi:UDP-N-acetylglucosamine 2-epimerase (non-hydrolysing)